MPEVRKISKNFLLPIIFSKIKPKITSAKRLKRRWENEPWRKIAVTNLHGSVNEELVSRSASVIGGKKDWSVNTKTRIRDIQIG